MMLFASVVAFVVVTGTRFLLVTRNRQLVVGTAATYVALVLLVLARALVHGDGALAEAVMWLPIMVMFGVPIVSHRAGRPQNVFSAVAADRTAARFCSDPGRIAR